MNFKKAFELMKQGKKMKLPSWGGYWCWDNEKQTIMIHCREKDSDTGKDILDIRETQRVGYTLKNILSDEWLEATEENCTLLGGTPTFDFGKAIEYMKRGLKVKRKGWDNYFYLDKKNKLKDRNEFYAWFEFEDLEATD